MIDQITVFLENSEGRLASMCRTLADADVNMSALSIADTTDFGVVRIIADDPAKAVKALTDNDYRAAITSVAAIAVPNKPGGLADLLETLVERHVLITGDDRLLDALKLQSFELVMRHRQNVLVSTHKTPFMTYQARRKTILRTGKP